MLTVKQTIICSVFCLASADTIAGIYQHVDPITGHITLSNIPPRGQVQTAAIAAPLAPAAPARASHRPAANSSTSTAPNFPRVTQAEQRGRDTDRQQILADELKTEQEALNQVTAKNAAGDVITRHRANIAALERELNNLK